MWSTDEGNPNAVEMQYWGLNRSLELLSQPYEHASGWLLYYLEYVEFLNAS